MAPKIRIEIETGPDPAAEAAVEQMIVETLRRRLRAAIGLMSCPRHGRSPTVTARGRAGTRFDFHVTGCCPDFVRRVKWRLEGL